MARRGRFLSGANDGKIGETWNRLEYHLLRSFQVWTKITAQPFLTEILGGNRLATVSTNPWGCQIGSGPEEHEEFVVLVGPGPVGEHRKSPGECLLPSVASGAEALAENGRSFQRKTATFGGCFGLFGHLQVHHFVAQFVGVVTKTYKDLFSEEGCNFTEVLQWYQGWKALFPPELREQLLVQRHLAHGLEVMKHVMAGGEVTPEAPAEKASASAAAVGRSLPVEEAGVHKKVTICGRKAFSFLRCLWDVSADTQLALVLPGELKLEWLCHPSGSRGRPHFPPQAPWSKTWKNADIHPSVGNNLRICQEAAAQRQAGLPTGRRHHPIGSQSDLCGAKRRRRWMEGHLDGRAAEVGQKHQKGLGPDSRGLEKGEGERPHFSGRLLDLKKLGLKPAWVSFVSFFCNFLAMPNKNPFPWVPRGFVNAFFPWLRWGLMWFYTVTYRSLSLFPSLRDRSKLELQEQSLLTSGSCVSVNIGRSIPKMKVKEALVTPMGLLGDSQKAPYIAVWGGHAGFNKAVMLWSAEVIAAINGGANGTPTNFFYGASGEQLTLSGVDWSQMKTGVRVLVGGVLLEVTYLKGPCKNLDPYFSCPADKQQIDPRKFGDSARVLAKVLRPGKIHLGDPVKVFQNPRGPQPLQIQIWCGSTKPRISGRFVQAFGGPNSGAQNIHSSWVGWFLSMAWVFCGSSCVRWPTGGAPRKSRCLETVCWMFGSQYGSNLLDLPQTWDVLLDIHGKKLNGVPAQYRDSSLSKSIIVNTSVNPMQPWMASYWKICEVSFVFAAWQASSWARLNFGSVWRWRRELDRQHPKGRENELNRTLKAPKKHGMLGLPFFLMGRLIPQAFGCAILFAFLLGIREEVTWALCNWGDVFWFIWGTNWGNKRDEGGFLLLLHE